MQSLNLNKVIQSKNVNKPKPAPQNRKKMFISGWNYDEDNTTTKEPTTKPNQSSDIK